MTTDSDARRVPARSSAWRPWPWPPAAATPAATRPTEQGEAIEDGKATGTIEVWAMGTEGEILGDFSAAFEEANPDAEVEVTAVPWDSRARQDRQRDRRPARPPTSRLVGTTWMGEFAESGGLEPTPRGPRRRRRLLRGRLGHHRGGRHVLRRPVVRRDPRPLLPQGPGREGRLGPGARRPGTS